MTSFFLMNLVYMFCFNTAKINISFIITEVKFIQMIHTENKSIYQIHISIRLLQIISCTYLEIYIIKVCTEQKKN